MEASYDAANRMQTITLKPSADASSHKTFNLSYDANGNLTQKQNAANPNEKTTYTWDAADKLTGLTQTQGGQSVSATYQYDLFGRRISSTIQQGSNNAADTVHYLYEGPQALGEIRNQSLSHRLITGLSLDETIARIAMAGGSGGNGNIDTQASRQMLTDALNSVIAQANAQDGGIANSYGYSPYGESQTIGPDATGNTAQYTSRENDAQGATGLYFYRARYYDPVLKRFISEDPIGLQGGDNVFAYVGGDPVSAVDPMGLQSYMCAAGLPAWCPPPPKPKPPPPPPGFNEDPCVRNYLQQYYGSFVANTMIPNFSALSYVPGSGTAGQAWASTAISVGTKGTLVGAPYAFSTAVNAMGAAGAGVAGGSSSSALLAAGGYAGTFAGFASGGIAVFGAATLPFSTSANAMALMHCSCKK